MATKKSFLTPLAATWVGLNLVMCSGARRLMIKVDTQGYRAIKLRRFENYETDWKRQM